MRFKRQKHTIEEKQAQAQEKEEKCDDDKDVKGLGCNLGKRSLDAACLEELPCSPIKKNQRESKSPAETPPKKI